MRLETKKEIVTTLKENFEATQTAFLVDYRGLNVAELTELRAELRKFDSSLRVVKNSLARIACQGTPTENIQDEFRGPIALSIANDYPVEVSKTLLQFRDKHPQLEIKSALLQGKKIDAAEIEALAKLPAKEVLYAKLLSLFNAPIQSLYNIFQENSRMLVRVIKAKSEQEQS